LALVLILFLGALEILIAQAPSTATLDVYIRAAGQPAAARVYLRNEAGQVIRIPGAPWYAQGGEEHSVVDQSGTVSLPAGPYRIRAEKGPEFRPAERTIELVAGEPARLDLDLPRFYNMNERGWYSGDLHLHRAAEDMPLLLRAEELNIGPVISRHVREGAPEQSRWPNVHLMPSSGNYAASRQNEEVERLGRGSGALLLLNTGEPWGGSVMPQFPTEAELARRARSQGGFIDAEKPTWKYVPVNLALRLLDSIGLVNSSFHAHGTILEAGAASIEREKPGNSSAAGLAQWMMDLYYSFLNCGFRIPVSGGSGSGMVPSWPGYGRVYVHLSGPFSYKQWFQDLQAGRSMATNGPLLDVSVNGEPPGAAFSWVGPDSSVLAIEAHSQSRLDRVELVFNGEVIRTFPAGGNAVLRTALNLTITEPGWLAVRCFEPPGDTVRFAHTSPFYFLRNGQLPAKPPASTRWAVFVSSLAAALDPADFPTRSDYDQARAALQKAESVYRNLGRGNPE
jgi:hypothetical protein